MFGGFGLAAQDIASTIALLLPGFVAVSLFEITNPAISRDRQAVQWGMWSLVFSLLLFAAVHSVYRWAEWPRDPLDPQFYAGLLAVAALVGYLTGRAAGSPWGRWLTRRLRILLPPWVWVEVMTTRQWVVVHLLDGTKLWGYPRRFTDDSRERTKELYLEHPHILSEGGESGAYLPFPQADGVLIDSSQIQFIEFLVPPPPTEATQA